MAFITQLQKKEKLQKLKPLLAQYGVRATLSIHDNTRLNLNIWESSMDFMGQYNIYKENNPEKFSSFSDPSKALDNVELHTRAGRLMEFQQFTGKTKEFLLKANKILQEGNFDKSDSQIDYSHVGFYSCINIGDWGKPFKYNPDYKKVAQQIKTNTQIKDFEIVDYSDKAVAVFGNTKEIKDKLKSLGGRFNPFLKRNSEKVAGWIFKKELKNDLLELIKLYNHYAI